ncbi:unnamed protein product, partial [Polarella glacialis]
VGLHQDVDSINLSSFLEVCTDGQRVSVGRHEFAVGVRDLIRVLHRVRPQLSLAQLRLVLATAFDRFDVNGDGLISASEFAAAVESFDVHLLPEEISVLHRFLAPSDGC